MQFVAVEGSGNPNDENGTYQQALGTLYGVQYTIKMSKMGSRVLKGYFDYVVPHHWRVSGGLKTMRILLLATSPNIVGFH